MISTASLLEVLDELAEEAKELDRAWARQVLELVREHKVILPT